MVGNFFRRLGLAGGILIAAVLVFGVLAGAVVSHRLQLATFGEVQGQGERDARGEDQGESQEKDSDEGQSDKSGSSKNSTNNH
jgi:hypothetical protein